MILLKADHDRRLEIPGVVGLVRRPVDIDQAATGFTALRTLRIYRFDAHSVINGHAEEDEVFIVVLTGLIDLMMSTGKEPDERHFTLAAVGASSNKACAAYLPPHATYRLVPRSEADIAYVRATPLRSRPPRVFTATPCANPTGVSEVLDEPTYAERLRLRLVRIEARHTEIALAPIRASDAMCETLVHLRILPDHQAATMTQSGGAPVALDSWDTISIAAGEDPTLRIAAGSSAFALITAAA